MFIKQKRKGTEKVQNSWPRNVEELTISRTRTIRDGVLKDFERKNTS